MSRTASHVQSVQYGVLPWRRAADGLQLLLITTRSTKRWIVPKGWPEKNMAPNECAAHEAYEEAGVLGDVADQPIGTFSHRKQLKSGHLITCRIHVFDMEVTGIAEDWPEKDEREIRWCTAEEAMALASDLGLRRIVAKFCNAATAEAA